MVQADDPDAELIRKLLSGNIDEAAWVEFCLRIQRRIGFKFGRLSSQAEDLAAETALRAFQNIRSFERRSSFWSWVYKIGFHVCCEYLRKNGGGVDISLDDLTEEMADPVCDVAQEAQEEFERQFRQMAAEEALASLPETQRTIYILRERDDEDYKVIAMRLNITENAARLAKYRATEKIGRWRRENLPD